MTREGNGAATLRRCRPSSLSIGARPCVRTRPQPVSRSLKSSLTVGSRSFRVHGINGIRFGKSGAMSEFPVEKTSNPAPGAVEPAAQKDAARIEAALRDRIWRIGQVRSLLENSAGAPDPQELAALLDTSDARAALGLDGESVEEKCIDQQHAK